MKHLGDYYIFICYYPCLEIKFPLIPITVINELYLTSYVKPVFEQQSQKSDNRVINPTSQTNVQEVEEILDSRWRGDKLQYLIKWRGQLLEERTWESRDEVIKGVPRSYKEFHQKHPDAPRVPVIQLPGKTYCEGDQSRALQEIPQLNYTMEYITTHLQEIPQRIR